MFFLPLGGRAGVSLLFLLSLCSVVSVIPRVVPRRRDGEMRIGRAGVDAVFSVIAFSRPL